VAKKASSSKFAVSDLLFKPEPPILPADVKRLFHARSAELSRGLETLKANLDIDGKRSKRSDKRPWVIHGESRSGKSHLARRIFAELPSTGGRIQCIIPCGGRLDAMILMRELFEDLRGQYKNRLLDQRMDDNPLAQPIVALAEQLIDKIALFKNDVQAVELTYEAASKKSFDLGTELGGAPLLLKFLTKIQTEQSSKNSVKVTLRPPTPLDLAEVCGIMVETLLRLGRLRHALILVDDVDLIEGYISSQQNARQQRSVLAEALSALHGTAGVDVVLTARSWYAHAKKDLSTLIDLALASQLTPDELIGIHDRRFKLYGGKSGLAGFLARPALQQFAQDVEGLPGVFLQHLNTAFYHYQNEGDPAERDYPWLLQVFLRRLPDWRDKCGKAMAAIEQAMKSGRRTVDISEGNPFFGTVLDNEFVYQSYDSETTYFISGFMRKVLASSGGSP
jgi:hypothetical protein